MAQAIAGDGFIHVFGTGHSMMTLEMLYIAGGLVRIYPIQDPQLSIFSGGLRSTFMSVYLVTQMLC